ncbi:hypothetical protein SDRG_13757 [Saprolegnia diclina VS20]|uniref:Uncharacterized protein n=1 Tax=Saprolegnia diclina (strain VS20) TaxID=1156394 RepID=T0PSG8_SAPDV|nr:hypothetical protein SDRG_13757 [Saprolegnia diclina VS20]EQC28429.1 hypothetical protein SDRG_13757 [Saprolegnia diclina VS20]|eukprot:XP_008618077.1 hypothetical protein SDRG_13757 [Saprolegnia diclina VS20]
MFHMRRGIARSARFMRRHPNASSTLKADFTKIAGPGRRMAAMAPRATCVPLLDIMDALRRDGVDQISLMYHSLVDDEGR